MRGHAASELKIYLNAAYGVIFTVLVVAASLGVCYLVVWLIELIA